MHACKCVHTHAWMHTHTHACTHTYSRHFTFSSTVAAKKGMSEGLQSDLPYLGADEVIEEVVVILAKLEKDRLETKAALQKERDRGRNLRTKIDTLAQYRLVNLPKAVQKGECYYYNVLGGFSPTRDSGGDIVIMS